MFLKLSVLYLVSTGILGRVSYDAFAICFFGTCQVRKCVNESSMACLHMFFSSVPSECRYLSDKSAMTCLQFGVFEPNWYVYIIRVSYFLICTKWVCVFKVE